MRRTAQLTIAAALVAGTLFAQNHNAFADSSANTYRQAMGDFVPDIAGWTAELNTLASAAMTKPELACGADMQELAARGGWMTDDLVGTAAPDRMAPLHVELTDAVRAMTSAAKSACGDPNGATQAIQSQQGHLDHALSRIRAYAAGYTMPKVK